MMREMRTPGQSCGLKVRLGNIKTGTLKCALNIAIKPVLQVDWLLVELDD